MKKIFIIGYYGYNNIGDEMLFESILEIFKELEFSGNIYIISDKINQKEKYNFKIINIEKYDFPKIINTIKESDIVIYGGGNLFQTETSLRSFIYYETLFGLAKRYKKNILFLSQGFGHFKHKYAIKKMKKILKYENLHGILRDKTSYIYAKRFTDNFQLGTDIGVLKYKNKQFEKNINYGQITLVIKNRKNWDSLIYILKQSGINRIVPVAFNKSQDSIYAYEFYENYKNKIDLSFPIYDEEKIIDEYIKSEYVISDRLHGGILALYLKIPVIMYRNQKNYRVFTTIDENYNLFYRNEEDLIFKIASLPNYSFDNIFEKYGNKFHESYQKTLNLIKTFL
ncbi:polysaccharide pyruvyl transferase family protein [Marinitoga litoralis]|uniref:polysaccharide pyruvyl transferase family protein n=1 Tax=Marinitoga litoralis TaxID=570855 RepID=UPI001961AFD6|nr:polysaccharide pyruvyl transferase family protein [Marinitoga litoralis]MBM7559404.1 polysaccharide pyruvyl transferase CsaB [Marinitoga litoralis]